ncbi:hypothetical protein FKM82_019195 [Ascaphus truei]
MAAPTAEERKACWGARDHYWQCMDENKEDISKCQKFRHCFESRCPQQWVDTQCWTNNNGNIYTYLGRGQ